jgi:hypothetical protein
MGQRLNGYWLAEVVSATVNPDGSAIVYFLVKQGLNNATWSVTAALRQSILDGTVTQIISGYYGAVGITSLDEVSPDLPIVLRLTDLQRVLAVPTNGGNGNGGNGGNGNGGNGNGTGVKTGISPVVIAIGAIAVIGLILLMQKSKTTGG